MALRRGPGLLCAVPTSGAAVLALQAQRPDGRGRLGQRRRGTRAVRVRCSGGSPGACGGPCRAVWPRAGSRRERQVQQELGGQKAEGGASWDVPTGAAMGVLHIRASSTPSSSMAPQNVDPWTLRSDVQARATQTRDGTWTRGPAFLPVPRGDPEPRGQAAPCVGPVHMHAGLGCTRARSRRPPPRGRSIHAALGTRHAAPLQPAAPSARACGPAFLPLPQDAASQGAVPLGAPHAPGAPAATASPSRGPGLLAGLPRLTSPAAGGSAGGSPGGSAGDSRCPAAAQPFCPSRGLGRPPHMPPSAPRVPVRPARRPPRRRLRPCGRSVHLAQKPSSTIPSCTRRARPALAAGRPFSRHSPLSLLGVLLETLVW